MINIDGTGNKDNLLIYHYNFFSCPNKERHTRYVPAKQLTGRRDSVGVIKFLPQWQGLAWDVRRVNGRCVGGAALVREAHQHRDVMKPKLRGILLLTYFSYCARDGRMMELDSLTHLLRSSLSIGISIHIYSCANCVVGRICKMEHVVTAAAVARISYLRRHRNHHHRHPRARAGRV